MLKAIYYYNGFKIVTDVDADGHVQRLNRGYLVYRLDRDRYERLHGRKGAYGIRGHFECSYPTYDEAVEYIKKTKRRSRHLQPEQKLRKERNGK